MGEMKKCELCMLPARAYCEADAAHLCWDCDGSVHGANFLVERHQRRLLCYVCHSQTNWSACGQLLGRHTISLCDGCAQRRRRLGTGHTEEARIQVDSMTTASVSDGAPPCMSTTSSSSSSCASSSSVNHSGEASRNPASKSYKQCVGIPRVNGHRNRSQIFYWTKTNRSLNCKRRQRLVSRRNSVTRKAGRFYFL